MNILEQYQNPILASNLHRGTLLKVKNIRFDTECLCIGEIVEIEKVTLCPKHLICSDCLTNGVYVKVKNKVQGYMTNCIYEFETMAQTPIIYLYDTDRLMISAGN